MKLLTAAQARVLKFVLEFQRERQVSPTRAEISIAMGWASANAAEEHLRALARKGRLRLESRSRGIYVLNSDADMPAICTHCGQRIRTC